MALSLYIILALFEFPLLVLSNISVMDIQSNVTIATFADLQASFGPDFPKDGLQGHIIMANPKNACTTIDEAPIPIDNYPSVAMIARGGNCEFAEKVINAQKANFSAAIIHNYHYRERLIKMVVKNGSRVHIPSTFVGYTTGMRLKEMFANHPRDYIVTIQEQDDIDYRLYLWPFAIVVGVCFFVVLVFLLVKYVKDRVKKTLNLLSKRHLKKIPIRKFKKGQYYDTCAICLDEYEDGEKIRILPCDHAYHTKCIDPWLTKNKKTCPVCQRRVIPGKDPDCDSDTSSDFYDHETAPLLGAGPQTSHGSLRVSPSVQSGSIRAINPIDETQGAVGGLSVSGRPAHQDQVRMEKEVDGGEDAKTDTSSIPTEDSTEDRKAERREKRKKKKEKKREGRKARRQEAQVEEASSRPGELSSQSLGEQQCPSGTVITVQAEVQPKPTEAEGGAAAEAAAEGYINPSFSESQEVIVPGTGTKQEMNEVV